MKSDLGQDSEAWFGQDLKLKFLRYWCLVEILKLMLNQDFEIGFDPGLWKNLWYKLNPWVRCAFGNVSTYVALEEMSAKNTVVKILSMKLRELRRLALRIWESLMYGSQWYAITALNMLTHTSSSTSQDRLCQYMTLSDFDQSTDQLSTKELIKLKS